MELRQLKLTDFYALRDLLDGVFSRKYGRETHFAPMFPRIFAEPNEYCTSSHWGAFDGDRLIGTAAMYPMDYVVGGVHVKLIGNGNVAVHEDYRGQGVMMQLLWKINEECDKVGDVGYLHGKVDRYEKVGYIPGGSQYVCTFAPGDEEGFEFVPMLPEEVEWHQARSAEKCDYLNRAKEDFIPALRSQKREAISVFRNGTMVGYLSLNRGSGAVEEFAFADEIEVPAFRALAKELGCPAAVRLSGYDVKTLARVKDDSEVKQSQPAQFRIINAAPLKEGALALGLPEDTIYAPYLT